MQSVARMDEFETLTLEIVDCLATAPDNVDALAGKVGTDRESFDASIDIGIKGSFLFSRRSRVKTILLNPIYFSENAEIFADHIAKCVASSVQKNTEVNPIRSRMANYH